MDHTQECRWFHIKGKTKENSSRALGLDHAKCDVSFIVFDHKQQIKATKAVLSANSEYFEVCIFLFFMNVRN